jgi:hypothetical protein
VIAAMAAFFLLWCNINATIAEEIMLLGSVVPSIIGSLLLFLRLLEGVGELFVPSVLVGLQDLPETHKPGFPDTLKMFQDTSEHFN